MILEKLCRILLGKQGRYFRTLMMVTCNPIEQRMLNQRPRESGAGVLSTQPPSSQTEVNNTCFRNVENTAVAAQLKNLFPTVGKR